MSEEFFSLRVSSLVKVDGGPLLGTCYSLATACTNCGTGAEPVGPRIIRRFHIPSGNIFITLDREILVNLDLACELEAMGIESIVDVIDVKSGEKLPLKELRAETTLPPFSKGTTGYEREGVCLKCGRDGYFNMPNMPLRLVYEDLTIEYSHKKVLATYERFGNSRLREPFKDSVFAAPKYILNGTVASYIKKACGRRVTIEPVEINWVK